MTTKDIPCPCNGKACDDCEGWGYITVDACLACMGSGKDVLYPDEKCGACQGRGHRSI